MVKLELTMVALKSPLDPSQYIPIKMGTVLMAQLKLTVANVLKGPMDPSHTALVLDLVDLPRRLV
jgi:hypothetical protein